MDVWSAGHHDPIGVAASPRLILPPEQRLRTLDDADISFKAEKGSKWGGLAVGWANMPWGRRDDWVPIRTIEPAGRAHRVFFTRPAVVSILAQVGSWVLRATLDWEQLWSWQITWSKPESLEVDAGRTH